MAAQWLRFSASDGEFKSQGCQRAKCWALKEDHEFLALYFWIYFVLFCIRFFFGEACMTIWGSDKILC